MQRMIKSLAAVALSLFLGTALAENSTSADGYTIHHNAITTDMLTPEISRAYRIPRSRNRGMVNVSVIREQKDTTGQPVAASVRAWSTNYLGQQRPIAVREIREGEAIYYIGDFLVRHGESLTFGVEVRPAGESRTFTARWTQEFFTQP